jgi:hypothetical protein
MKIFEGIFPGFGHNKAPIFIRMGEFFQQGVQPFLQAVIFRHHFLKDGIFFIYGDINMIVGQIDFKSFGFNLHRIFFLKDTENQIKVSDLACQGFKI